MILMKAEKIFTIGSIITFFALIPALIVLQVRVLKSMPEISYLFIIMDILLVGFIVLEIVLMYRKWKKEKEQPDDADEALRDVQIEKQWGEEDKTKIETSEG